MPRPSRLFRVLLPMLLTLAVSPVPSRSAVLTNYVLQWGSQGSGNGQFNDPAGVAVDYNGLVFITDMGNDRVQVFNGLGSGSRTKSPGSALIATSRPRRVSRARYTSPMPPAPSGAMIS